MRRLVLALRVLLLSSSAGCFWSVAIETSTRPEVRSADVRSSVPPDTGDRMTIYEDSAVRVAARSSDGHAFEIVALFYVVPMPVPWDGPDSLCITLDYRARGADVTVERHEVMVRTLSGGRGRRAWARTRASEPRTPSLDSIAPGAEQRTVECFDWPGDARAPFVLEVRGVRLGGRRVAIPPILFRPRTRTRRDFVFFPVWQ